MKKIKLLLILTAMLVLLLGCESGGKIKIINATDYNVYTTIEGIDYTIAGNDSKTIKVDTEKKVFLIDDGETDKTIEIDGETFIVRKYNGQSVTTTDVKIEPGETTNIYCVPNCASFKVINNSDKYITRIEYRDVSQFVTHSWFGIDYGDSFGAGEFNYIQLPTFTEENPFWYNFKIFFSDGSIIPYGTENSGTYLSTNEQYLIEYNNFGE